MTPEQAPGSAAGRPAPATRAVVAGIGRAFPGEPVGHDALWDGFFRDHFAGSRAVERIWRQAGVRTRHAVVNPLVEDVSAWSTEQRMLRYADEAAPLGHDAVAAALADAGLAADDVRLLVVASCTGYATPGLDVRLAGSLGLATDTRRLLVGHMGCYAALPALGSAAEFVVARGEPAVVLCLELTSLHVQPPTRDVGQVVAHALFGDAAVAVVLTPDTPGVHAPGARRVRGAASAMVTDAAVTDAAVTDAAVTDAAVTDVAAAAAAPARLAVVDVVARTDLDASALMTWDVTDLGFRMGLSPAVPSVLARHVAPAVKDLVARNGLDVADVASWAVHPGGPAILDTVQRELGLPPSALAVSRAVLADAGNCSSPTVLLVVDELLRGGATGPMVAMAFGPGLTLYAALLR